MKYISVLFLSVVLLSACTDPELDPFQLDKIKKGSIIALRGQAAVNLNNLAFRGAVDTFSVSGNIDAEKFEFDAAFLSDDLNSLDKVDIYARQTPTSARARITTVAGTAFTLRPDIDKKYPSAFIEIPLRDILTALNISINDIDPNDPGKAYLYIESDLTLKDGTIVPASAIVNEGLFQSSIFYPAHNLRYLAKP